jgi:hypothetical protein
MNQVRTGRSCDQQELIADKAQRSHRGCQVSGESSGSATNEPSTAMSFTVGLQSWRQQDRTLLWPFPPLRPLPVRFHQCISLDLSKYKVY